MTRRYEHYVGRRAMEMKVPGKRGKAYETMVGQSEGLHQREGTVG